MADEPFWRDLLARRRFPRPISWLRPRPLLESANQIVDASLSDIITPRRQRWVAAQRDRGHRDPTFEVPVAPGPFSFLLLGDPGEADESQYAVVKPLLAEAEGTEFMVIVSDVIYPAGDINGYVDGFYLPYAEYDKPIYALPGNHDWLDGLNGFMFHFCDAEPLPGETYNSAGLGLSGRLARLLWRASDRPRRDLLLSYKQRRPKLDPPQPGPYWAMDVGENLRLVAIDTGVDGTLDREQAKWLIDVSGGDRRKLLLTGKPLLVNNKLERGPLNTDLNPADPDDVALPFETVDAIVRHDDHHYLAAIGGDIHNYQRYILRDGKGREFPYVVSGGGGAFLSATHLLEPADGAHDGWTSSEQDFRCYPLRGDSLFHFTRLLRSHGAHLATAAYLLGVLLVIAAVRVGWGDWDLDELATLFGLAAGAGAFTPWLVLNDFWRGLENGVKLGVVAGLVALAARGPDDPLPWVLAGMVFVPLAHALIFFRRHLFSWLLVGASLLMLTYVLRGTPVADHAALTVTAFAALFAVYLALHRAVAGAVACVVVAAIAASVGLTVFMAGLLAVGALVLFAFCLLSGLWCFPMLNAAESVTGLAGAFLGQGWGRPATSAEAALWLSRRRLSSMPTTRDSSGASVDAIPRLWRLMFFLQYPTNGPWRAAQSKFSEIFDTNRSPFFRHFLRVDVDTDHITITCFGASGKVMPGGTPPIEDRFEVSFEGKVTSLT